MSARSLDMNGPFELSLIKLRKAITRISPGNYALGFMLQGTFMVKYIGRSDTDLLEKLIRHLGTHPHLTHFKASYAKTAEEAFAKECKNYHDYENCIENAFHPSLNHEELDATCPACEG